MVKIMKHKLNLHKHVILQNLSISERLYQQEDNDYDVHDNNYDNDVGDDDDDDDDSFKMIMLMTRMMNCDSDRLQSK